MLAVGLSVKFLAVGSTSRHADVPVSAVPAKPYADMSQFPELRQVTALWQVIRDEALKL